MNQSIPRIQYRNEKDGDVSSIASVLNIFFENKWLIAGVALVTILLGTMYAYSVKPIYEANILIQVKDSASAAKDSPGDLPAALDTKTQTATEVEVLRSRTVLARAVDATHLDIHAEPKYFPILGAAIARANTHLSNPGILGYGGYAWGAEHADISAFNLPASLAGRPFMLTAGDGKNFVLTENKLGIKLEGKVGEVAKAATEYGNVEIVVDALRAKSGAQFSVSRTPKIQTVEQLQKALVISEKGRQSNIIGVTLTGSKPELISKVLNEIGDEYIRQNVAQKSAAAEKALAFFNQQLPEVRQKLERSESKSAELRSTQGAFDVNEEANVLSQQSVAVQTRLADAKQRKDELLARFTGEHPSVALVNKQIQDLNRELAGIKGKLKKLPAVEQEVLGVTRDKQVSSDLYTGLASMGRQLDLLQPGRIGNVRLLDRAESPVEPITPKPSMMIAVACLAGLLLGVAAAYMKSAFVERINGPRDIEQALGLTVCATIPHSEIQTQLYKTIWRNTNKVLVLPHDAPSEDTIESLRSFRSTLQFSMRDSQRNIIMITGPTPEVGKSFVCANFASVLASVGKRVLLIDADMRTGYLHRYFGVEQANGLSDVLARMASIESVIHKDVVGNVDFISTGNFPNKPAELLAHAHFGRMLRSLTSHYDYILIDTAPVLGFSDALIVGLHAETIFNVVRNGVSTVHEVDEAVKRLNRAGLAVTGAILNDLKPGISRYGYASRYRTADIIPASDGNDVERVRLIRG